MKRTFFITGTSSGFGKLTAITLSKAGHIVIAGTPFTTKYICPKDHKKVMPNWLVKIAAYFKPELKSVSSQVGKVKVLSKERTTP